MPATTTGANENLFFYMSTLSLSLSLGHGEEREKREPEEEKACVKMREIHAYG